MTKKRTAAREADPASDPFWQTDETDHGANAAWLHALNMRERQYVATIVQRWGADTVGDLTQNPDVRPLRPPTISHLTFVVISFVSLFGVQCPDLL